MHPSVCPSISTIHVLPENQPAGPSLVSKSWLTNAHDDFFWQTWFTERLHKNQLLLRPLLPFQVFCAVWSESYWLHTRKMHQTHKPTTVLLIFRNQLTSRSSQKHKTIFQPFQNVWKRKASCPIEGWLSIDTRWYSRIRHIMLSQERLHLLLLLTFWF